ncbi:hypothetical protein KY362_03995 [Candidatus Woesearchaeota archaeon]|nr:hypothetical protein [Candidatus Woesearchaeota archaeon]
MRRKKASLSLSINAIVILVLAITMLGLGLAFTKGMFGKLSERLSVPEPDIPATPDDPIVLPVEELSITKNKQFVFSVNVYNDEFSGPVDGLLSCPVGSEGQTAMAVPSPPQEIPPGEDKGFKFIIPKDLVGQSSTRICSLTFTDTDEPPNTESEQVVVTVK